MDHRSSVDDTNKNVNTKKEIIWIGDEDNYWRTGAATNAFYAMQRKLLKQKIKKKLGYKLKDGTYFIIKLTNLKTD